MSNETYAIIILIASFIILIAHNIPIAFSIGISTFLAYLFILPPDLALVQIAKDMWHGIDSYALLAIPLFIIAGLLMGEGGIAHRLVSFSEVLFGRFIAGLCYTNVMACCLFGAISGSATAAASSIGSFIIPEMEEAGYKREFATALTISSATLGIVIPPSNVMIVYAVAWGDVGGMSVDVAAMFISGFLPGIIIAIGLMITSRIIVRNEKIKIVGNFTPSEMWKRFSRSILGLLLMFIVLGGIMFGFFTATEASAVAVIYSLFLSMAVYRNINISKLLKILKTAAITTAFIFLLISTSKAMGNLMVRLELPQMTTDALLGLTNNKILLLLIINLILLFVGTFMDVTPAVLIFTPIFSSIVVNNLGIHPIHFGLILIVNLCIGLCTPPVGTALFVGCGVGKTTISKLIKPMIPFYASMFITLLIITYLPEDIILWLPRLLSKNI